MKIFVVASIVFGAVFISGIESLKADSHLRQKRDLSDVTNIAVQEGSVMTYVARRWHEDNLVVGKFIPQWNTIYLPYYGKELSFQDGVDVISTNGQHMWIPYPGYVPGNAIEGGKEGMAKLYIGRKWYNDKNVNLIGKIVQGQDAIYCPYFGSELRFEENFDILVQN